MASKKVVVRNLIASANKRMSHDQTISESAKVIISELSTALLVLSNQAGLNSTNSSKPPSSDIQKEKIKKTTGSIRKPGGQMGHSGSNLKKFDTPTVIEKLLVDRELLPDGEWTSIGFESRQVVDVEIKYTVTEYQAEILKNTAGKTFIADFPIGVTEPVQYGSSVKATSVYLSQEQLIPQKRVQETIKTQYGLSISTGSINNFNNGAAGLLKKLNFEDYIKSSLLSSEVLHADETGINVNGEGYWLHCLCNEKLTYFQVDKKRGLEAMERIGVLSFFNGKLVHDHWKPYFKYLCTHVLCNAHHLRELERSIEQDGQKWAKEMKVLLLEINTTVNNSGEKKLIDEEIKKYHSKYEEILEKAEKECPENITQTAQTKSRNLLERFKIYEEEILLFMADELTPFTNNQGERDLRMTKVQQKISGCFRKESGAENFCLIRSYLSTCKKNGVNSMDGLKILFNGKLPDFMTPNI